jgi:hypothetical protein
MTVSTALPPGTPAAAVRGHKPLSAVQSLVTSATIVPTSPATATTIAGHTASVLRPILEGSPNVGALMSANTVQQGGGNGGGGALSL